MINFSGYERQRRSWNEKLHTFPNALDEITNKVFNEVLQGKNVSATTKFDVDSAKSDEFQSEISSTYNKHRSQVFQPQGLAISKAMKFAKPVQLLSEDTSLETKKPLITKLVPGVKVQTSSKTQGEGKQCI